MVRRGMTPGSANTLDESVNADSERCRRIEDDGKWFDLAEVRGLVALPK
jgi:hypothetical protein